MMISKKVIPRRTVLRGIGAGLALGGAAFLALPFGHDYRLPLFNVALPGSREIIHRYI